MDTGTIQNQFGHPSNVDRLFDMIIVIGRKMHALQLSQRMLNDKVDSIHQNLVNVQQKQNQMTRNSMASKLTCTTWLSNRDLQMKNSNLYVSMQYAKTLEYSITMLGEAKTEDE